MASPVTTVPWLCLSSQQWYMSSSELAGLPLDSIQSG